MWLSALFGLIVEMSKSLWRAEEFSNDCVFVGIGHDAAPSEDCVRCYYHLFFFSIFFFMVDGRTAVDGQTAVDRRTVDGRTDG